MPSSGKAEAARIAPSGNLPPTHPAHPAGTQPGGRPSSAAHPDYPAVTVSEHEGVLYLHLGTEWIQGGMRMDKPDALEIEYVQQMMMWALFNPQPQHIVQLGLGAGALTKFCYRQFPNARISAIALSLRRKASGLRTPPGRISASKSSALA